MKIKPTGNYFAYTVYGALYGNEITRQAFFRETVNNPMLSIYNLFLFFPQRFLSPFVQKM